MSVFVSIFCYINFAQKCDLYHSLTYIDFFSFFIMHFLAKKYRNFRLNSHISSCGIWKFQRNTFLFSFLFLIFPSLLTLKLPPHSFSDSLPSVCTPHPPSFSLSARSSCPEAFKSVLVHQLPNLRNLADWASERIPVTVGNLLLDPLPLSLSHSCPLASHCIFQRHAGTWTHKRPRTRSHWLTGEALQPKQAYLTFPPSQKPKEDLSEYHFQTNAWRSTLLKWFISFLLLIS